MNLNGMGVLWLWVDWESRGPEGVVNPERIEGAAFALAGRAAIDADLAADTVDVERRGGIEPTALAAAAGAAVSAGVGVVGMVMQAGGTEATAVAVAFGVAVNARIIRLWFEKTDSLGAGLGHGDAIILNIISLLAGF